MKYLILFLSLVINLFSFCQTVNYNSLTKKSVYTEYITKQGDTLIIGDTLVIGIPTSNMGFTYISQAGNRCASRLSNVKVVIQKFKTYGSKHQGFKVYVLFGGYGLIHV